MTSSTAEALTTLVVGGEKSDAVSREMIDALAAAVYATDAQGRLTYFNQAAVRLSGRVPELGTDRWCVTWKLFTPDGVPLPHDQCPMALALRGEDIPSGIECIAERPDGSRFWFTPCPAVVRDAEGRITGGINLLIDISDRKSSEIQAHENFRAIVDTTPECVTAVAADGTLLLMNSAGLVLAGASSAAEVIGKSVYDLVAPEDRQRFREFNEQICRGNRGELEFDVVGLAGDRRRLEAHAAPMPYSAGTTVQLAVSRDITHRKQAEQAGLWLAAIVNGSDDAIIGKDLNGVVRTWNRGAERLFGYRASEAIGQPISSLIIPPDRQNEETDILERLRRGERVDHFQTVRRRKDGALLDISLTISPIKDHNGKIIGASKIARDISERKRAEQAIQMLNAQLAADLAVVARIQQLSTRSMQGEEYSQLLSEIVDTAIQITGANMGNIQLFEEGVFTITAHRGFKAPFLDFLSTAHEGDAAWREAIERGERIIVEDVTNSSMFVGKPSLTAMLGAGIVAFQSTPLITRSGHVLGTLSTHYFIRRRPADRDLRLLDILARQTADVIERKRAEDALRLSERRFRQLADSMPQIVWTARPDGYVDYYNEKWYQFTGFSRDTFGDDSWMSILNAEDVQRTKDVYYSAINSGQPYEIEYRLWDRRENRFKWFMSRALPMRDKDGRIVRWFGACTGIDEQKRIEEDLRHANKELEQFAFSASHDLQEPLRTVKIYSELLMESCRGATNGENLEFLAFLHSAATRMEALVRDLLAYSQVTKTDTPLEISDAGAALQTALANLAATISETGASVTVDKLPLLPVHTLHLQQLFQNLIGNAVKFRSPERPPAVHVTAERQQDCWIFSVIDNGIGVEPKYKERIFGLFKRLHTRDDYPGTGIGLAICKRIVDRYHGRIWVDSEPGQGSAFRFTLPT